MGKQGWLTIRNVPDVPLASDGGVSMNPYHQQLVKFMKEHRLCPKCKGAGHRIKVHGKQRDETVVRFEGIVELEKINEMENVSLTDVIRDILERRCLGKRPCTLCHGSRFVIKKIAKEYKKKRKSRGKKVRRKSTKKKNRKS